MAASRARLKACKDALENPPPPTRQGRPLPLEVRQSHAVRRAALLPASGGYHFCCSYCLSPVGSDGAAIKL
ncbi:hypothetical protein PsYK624_151640 [Phanerochaete sordida]|uniref:Uncharacterized protein n=1 Tax=Phanerochaete sordida TaxID=48140 RepID=A0A9P3GNS9_9APHY|nr:hypothetical protein PsYK624_151640 [Phanerochaete sordida]